MTRVLNTYIMPLLRHPLAVYLAATMAVMLPLWWPGYILTLDMAWTPQLDAPTKFDNTYLFRWLVHILDVLLPSAFIQKLMLSIILLASGYGMHRLLVWLNSKTLQLETWAIYAAGLFYMINPFTYTRFMVGHYFVLLGYAVLPFFVLSLMKFLRAPTYKQALFVGLWAVCCTSVNIHTAFPVLIISTVLLVVHLLGYPAVSVRSLLPKVLIAGVIWLALSCFWVIPAVIGTGGTSDQIATFDERHLLAFATKPDIDRGLGFNVAGLHGFWADTDLRYKLPKTYATAWPVLTITIIGLCLAGLIVGIRKKQPYIIGFAVIGLIGWLFSMGTRGPGGTLYRWMLDVIPLFGGYREPQKFMVLLVLCYAVLLAVGASYVYRHVRQLWLKSLLIIFVVALPFIYTPTMFWGFGGQLSPVEYPDDWYALNDRFKRDTGDYKVLFLPWHMYQTFEFSNRVIATPAARFFDVPFVQGDNAEIGNLDTEGSTPDTLYIREQIIDRSDELTNMGAVLADRNIKYVVLAKTDELQKYDYLDKQKDLKKIQDSDQLVVYQNMMYK